MRHYNWNMAVMLTSTYELWIETGHELTKLLQDAAITVFRPAAFKPGEFNVEMLRNIKIKGIRIVILLDHQDVDAIAASTAMEEKPAQGMSSGWVWILTDEEAAIPQLQGWLFFRPLLPSDGMQVFAQQVSDYTASSFNNTLAPDSVDLTQSAALYDAVMLYAHAGTKVLAEGGDLHNGHVMAEAVRSTTFEGLGNRAVVLNSQGDRIQSYEVMSYVQGADAAMGTVPAGVYINEEHQYRAYERAVVWPGNTTAVPIDFVAGQPRLFNEYSDRWQQQGTRGQGSGPGDCGRDGKRASRPAGPAG